MLCDIHAAADPDLMVLLYVVKKPLQRGEPARPPGQPAVQANRHHSWDFFTFLIEHIKRVFQVIEKLLAGVEALRCDEAHIVGVETVRHYQLGLLFAAIR